MTLSIYNTLSNSKEKFTPLEAGKVKLYLCGPTVYGLLHIGNFRGPIVFNLFRNWMEHSGYKVTFVYNYTDIDDKIIKRAQEEGKTTTQVSEYYIEQFETDFKRLGLRAHDFNPKVSDHMQTIIAMIQELLEKNIAYEIEGEVFYEISKFQDYGKLSKNNLDELNAGQRVGVDERKRSPLDFVLWKPAKKDEPSWSSPWGEGRPGWHIECSAMIKKILGDQIDIHGGGIDLTFPHHECEIAQSEGCSDKKYANYWMHNNFINMNNEKMSKSLGNIIPARSFMDDYHPEVLKFLFLNAHYRSVLSVGKNKIISALGGLSRIYSSLLLAQITIDSDVEALDNTNFNKQLSLLDQKITKSMNDDFNSAEMISYLFEAVRIFNSTVVKGKKVSSLHKGAATYYLSWIKKYGAMAALFQARPKKALEEFNQLLIKLKGVDVAVVDKLIADREAARLAKNWKVADEIRARLDSLGIEVQDHEQSSWRVKIS